MGQDSVDVAWTFSFSIYAILGYFLINQDFYLQKSLTALITLTWSLRLGSYLYITRCKNMKNEDSRYSKMREKWSQKDFFIFYQAQALSAVPLATCLLLAMQNPLSDLSARHIIAIIIALVAIIGETLADKQLNDHKKNPQMKGKTCQSGLWKYSRHPNYFFEWLHWWAYVALAINTSIGLLSLMGPALMLYLFFRVTGIPPTEAAALKSRSDYREYMNKTSVFIPWFPKP